MAKARNGKIELLRFFFCMSVLFYHLNKDMWDGELMLSDHISFFSHGRTGVEFFFLVSGFLAAKSAARLSSSKSRASIGKSTYDFILKKINSVFAPHIIICVIVIIFLLANDKLTMKKFLEKLPSLVFLQTTGITDDCFLAVEWYIGAMLFALAVIYPFLLKSFDFTSRVAAPVGSSLIIGYMICTQGKLQNAYDASNLITLSNLRGLAVVSLGVFSYVICEEIKKADFTKLQKTALIVVENFCWVASMFFVVSNFSGKFEGIAVYLLALGVAITFSRTFNSKIYNNAFVMYLGKISLTVYLCQNFIRNLVKFNIPYGEKITYVILVSVMTVLMGIIIDFICDRIKKRKISKNKA